ncbi:universal stress protein [Corynebacterium freiburgense]|uniref:universal stress protein n=1 Tax=Corynebacterium freiburgense TaxID=556548 RepID=UPI00041FB2DF|nr:universal stress protein [Corynebacterium freiburgense]WJZ03396.1 Universal stress protein family protein [Corynebacterium freiburgense]
MKCVVGYEATPTGIDALTAGIDLARCLHLELVIVLVLRHHNEFSREYPPTGATNDILIRQGFTWLEGALSMIPDDVSASGHLVSAASTSEGLVRAAQNAGADLIVVGAASTSPLKRHRLGSVAQDLLYGAPVPVALAPRGHRSTKIERLNCAVGTRPGSNSLVAAGLHLAEHSGLPLRLVALTYEPETAAAHTEAVLKQAIDETGIDLPVEITLGEGEKVSEAVESVGWRQSDLLFVGSSRVAEPRTVFLGAVSMKILRELDVPMIVVPRDYTINPGGSP